MPPVFYSKKNVSYLCQITFSALGAPEISWDWYYFPCQFHSVYNTTSLVQVAVHGTQRVIMGLSMTCHLWWASTINIYDALNQPHTEHCHSNHPRFFNIPIQINSISISSAWWSHAVCWSSCTEAERAEEQTNADNKLQQKLNVCHPTKKREEKQMWKGKMGGSSAGILNINTELQQKWKMI